MSSSILEQIRHSHELTEAYESEVGAVLDQGTCGQRAKVVQQHHISALVGRIVDLNTDLKRQYADNDAILAEEISSMRGDRALSSFYDSLNSTKRYHDNFPNMLIEPLPKINPASIDIPFSGDEVFGKYLDLHELFHKFSNIPGIVKEPDYLGYLDKFNNFFYIQEANKSQKAYKQYLEDLWAYLINFFERIQPLVNTDTLISEWNHAFNERWDTGKVQGWVLKATSSSGTKNELRLGSFNSPNELEALGADRLKEGLEALGLKCGGTLGERAERLWSVRGLKSEDYPKKLLAKPTAVPSNSGGNDASSNSNSNNNNNNNSSSSSSSSSSSHSFSSGGSNNKGDFVMDDKRKQLGWQEFRIICLCDIMMDIITSTRRYVEKQQTRTREEKEKELYEEEFGILQDIGSKDADSDDDEPIYNPLNIPLGWDGKPIPYWLFKLHGLGVEYKCEICGNQSYWGRKQFDRHFQEPKHAQGMRALGIPNTKHFHDITKMEDAKVLYSKIRNIIQAEQFVATVEAEYEDSHGNILNKRTYEDLARQGLL